MLSNIVALTAGFAATVSAFQCEGNYFSFFNRAGPAMSYQRLDPALFPGTESPHLHSFDGGNGLSASTNFEDTQASSCTTARVKTDKSLYWRPTLFFNGNGTGFYRVPEKATKIYYKFGDGDNWANVTAFPEDFNMIAGDPYARSKNDNTAGVRWGCHEPDGGSTAIFADGFPKGFSSCNYGFASEVTFPSCWNGEELDPKNPNAHMAYPNGVSGVGIENCPTTHRAARFPTLFIEFWYDVSGFNGQYGPDDTPWVVANGDPSGFGFHGDFLNGWEEGVLEKAIGETGGCNCGCACGQEQIEQCFGAENVNDDSDDSWASCAAMTASGGDDEIHLDALPGCNPLQYGPEAATAVSGPSCTAAATPSASKTPASSAAASSAVASDASSAIYSAMPSAAYSGYSAVLPSDASEAATSASSKTQSASPIAYASISLSMPNKHVDSPTGGYDAAQPTPAASSLAADKSTPSLASTAVSADQTAAPSPSGDDEEDCKPPVYVTVTPTVYVTAVAAANATSSCDGNTVYETLTETATITIDAYGAMGTGSY